MVTKKSGLLIASGLGVTILGVLLYPHFSNQQWQYSAPKTAQIMCDVYADCNGFSIFAQERKKIEDAGGNPTYGEITFEAVEQLIADYKISLNEKGVFFDLGSGTGKVCTQVALRTPARAIGIELSKTRHELAQKTRQELIKKKLLKDKSKLQFIEQNILDADLSTATVIFLCSTCFSDDLMLKLSNKIAALPQVTDVITLKELPDPNKNFMRGKTYHLPMTWSQSSPVYTYQRW